MAWAIAGRDRWVPSFDLGIMSRLDLVSGVVGRSPACPSLQLGGMILFEHPRA